MAGKKKWPAPRTDDDLKRIMENPLYNRFSRMRKQPHTPEFDDFYFFVAWAKNNGYGKHMKLVRIDAAKPYSPDNCEWRPMKLANHAYGGEYREWSRRWTEAVNRIRVHYGMEPLPMPADE